MSTVQASQGISVRAAKVALAATLLAHCLCPSARAQTLQLQVRPLPVGTAPLGVDVTGTQVGIYAAVANSGDNSVSILQLNNDQNSGVLTVVSAGIARPVPSPYAVTGCVSTINLGDKLVVTSPSDNSASIVQVPQGAVVATVKVGAEPRAAACYFDQVGRKALVSNYGDRTLSVIDVGSGSILATIPGVPGARGLHGIGIYRDEQSRLFAWVGGTDANVITVVDLTSFKVLNQIPVRAPTSVRCCFGVASETDGTVTSYDPQTFAPGTALMSNLTKPQDVVFSLLGTFATQAGTNSVAASRAPAITGIPGAAGLATYAFNSSPSAAIVLITSTDSNSVYVVTQQPPLPAQFAMANGASFSGIQVAPGSLASAFAQTGVSQNFYATSLPLPASLGRVSLNIGGTLQPNASGGWTYSATGSSPAPLLFVGPTQVNFQAPPGIAPGDSVAAQLTKADGSTLLTTVRIAASAPGIFTVLMNGQGQAAALNQDNSQNGNPQAILGAKPAPRGSVIQVFATGAGATNPSLAAGEAAPGSGSPLVLTVAQPTVTMGGKTARVLFSGMAPGFVGLWQINAEVPQDVTPGSAVPLQVAVGSAVSNTATIAVQ